jgi:ABC-type antimicrobial peptide transport system permease subunit
VILLRKSLRDVRAMGIRALLMVLVVGVGLGAACGIRLALDDVRATRDAFYANQHLADLDVRLSGFVAPDTLLARARSAGAPVAETRLVLDGTVAGAQRTAAVVLGMDPQARLDRLAVVEGRALSDADPLGAVLEAGYAQHAGLHVGDDVDLTVRGTSLAVTVRGIVRSPEYLLATANPEYLIPQPGSLAVVFLPRGGLAAHLGLAGRVNDLVLDLPGGAAGFDAQVMTAGLPVAALTARSQQYSLRFTNADVRSFGVFVPVLGGVFAAVALLLIALSLRRMVHAQRRELGAMLAIGYRRRAVVATVLLPAVVLAVPGAVVAALTTLGVAWLVAADYALAVGFPTVTTHVGPIPLLAAVAALVVAAVAAVLPGVAVTRLTPAAAMHGDTGRFAPPAWLSRLTRLGDSSLTYAARSLLRHPWLSAATVVSLAAAIGLGVAMNIVARSTDTAVDAAFGGQGWTASVDLARPLPTDRATALARTAGASAVEPTAQGPGRVTLAGRGADVQVVGLAGTPQLQRLQLTSGALPAQGDVVLGEQTAATLHAAVGDTVRLATAGGGGTLTVSGIVRSLAADRAYLTFDDAASFLGAPGQTDAMLVSASAGAVSALRNDPAVARVTTLGAARSGMHDLVTELTALIDTLLAISLGVGGLFLGSSLAMSFLDRAGEFATLRALGHGRRRIVGTVVAEALAQAAVAGVLAVPAGLLVAWPLSAEIGAAWFRIGLHPAPWDFAWVIALAVVLAVLVALASAGQVLRIDIARTVRARLIG